MKIIFIGDIFGTAGKQVIKENLLSFRKKIKADLVIANGENAATNGRTMTFEDYKLLIKSGIDYFTMGNHTYYEDETNKYFKDINNLVRPGNYDKKKPGSGSLIIEYKGKKILLFNILGQTFMNIKTENPFHYADKILDENPHDFAILDFHAEATSEKVVMANYLKDRVNLVVGTHTHIQTSDARKISSKTAYITDLGMSGVQNSAIGMDFESVTNKLLALKNTKFKEASYKSPIIISGVIIKVNLNKPETIKIKTFQLKK